MFLGIRFPRAAESQAALNPLTTNNTVRRFEESNILRMGNFLHCHRDGDARLAEYPV
jgi:hypothetical protein